MGLLVDEVLQEEDFVETLAAILDLPLFGYRQGLYTERDLLLQVDASLIEKYKILPVRRRADEAIDLFVVEPLNPMVRGIMEESFGALIRPYIWPRIRYVQAQHFFLGRELPAWIRTYLKHHLVPLGYAYTKNQDIQKILQSAESLGITRWTSQDLQDFLKSCFDCDTLLKVLLGYGENWLSQRAILVISQTGLQPYFVEEWPTLPPSLHPVDALRENLLSKADRQTIQSHEDWIIDTPESFGITELFEILKAKLPSQVVMVPVAIVSRTAIVLIGTPTDRQTSIRLAELSDSQNYDDLQEIAQIVGKQLEEIIRLTNWERLPPLAERISSLPNPRHQVGLGFEDSPVELSNSHREDKGNRGEIVDIGQVIDDKTHRSEASDLLNDQDMENAIAGGLIQGHESPAKSVSEATKAMPLVAQVSHYESDMNAGTTSSGMPALEVSSLDSEEVPEECFVADQSEISSYSEVSIAPDFSESLTPGSSEISDLGKPDQSNDSRLVDKAVTRNIEENDVDRENGPRFSVRREQARALRR